MAGGDCSYVYKRRVSFKDTDVAGITHFTNLLAFVEEAEQAALISVGVDPISAEGGYPKVHVDCDYRFPARYRDEVEVRVSLVKVSRSSLKWSFEMMHANGTLVAEGGMVTAYVNSKGASTEISVTDRDCIQRLLLSE